MSSSDNVERFLRAFAAKNAVRCLAAFPPVVTTVGDNLPDWTDLNHFASDLHQAVRAGVYGIDESVSTLLQRIGYSDVFDLMRVLARGFTGPVLEVELLRVIYLRCSAAPREENLDAPGSSAEQLRDYQALVRDENESEALAAGAALIGDSTASAPLIEFASLFPSAPTLSTTTLKED